MNAVLVANPFARGLRRGGAVAQIEARLRAAGLRRLQCIVEPEPRRAAERLHHALREESPEETRVIVAGGDGTIRAALPAFAERGFPMAILPVGTLNVMAWELGVPRRLEEALAVAVRGRPRGVDICSANGQLFADMAGVGYDAAIVHSIVPAVGKTRLGYFGYIARALGLLARYRPSRFRIITESATLETEAWVGVVANTAHYAYHWQVSPRAVVDDGWLDLCLFQSASVTQTAGQVAALLANRHASYPGVLHVRARRFRIETDPPAHLQLDGDPVAQTPVDITMIPRALTVLVPHPPHRAAAARLPSPA